MGDDSSTTGAERACGRFHGSVPRVLRTSLPDGYFHVTSRGVNGCAIFRDDDDRRAFLAQRPLLRRAVPLDDARALPNDDALPPRPPQHAARALTRSPAAAGLLRAVLQPASRALRAPLRRPLRRSRDRRRALSESGVPIRRREPRPRRAHEVGRGVAVGAQPPQPTPPRPQGPDLRATYHPTSIS